MVDTARSIAIIPSFTVKELHTRSGGLKTGRYSGLAVITRLAFPDVGLPSAQTPASGVLTVNKHPVAEVFLNNRALSLRRQDRSGFSPDSLFSHGMLATRTRFPLSMQCVHGRMLMVDVSTRLDDDFVWIECIMGSDDRQTDLHGRMCHKE